MRHSKRWFNGSVLWHWLKGYERLGVYRDIVAAEQYIILDVSRWQGEINFATAKAAGAKGIIFKCAQGTTPDPRFADSWHRAREAGLLRGAYLFYDSRSHPVDQGNFFWDMLHSDPPEIGYWFDYEESYGGPYGGARNLRLCIETFLAVSGVSDIQVGIYTGYYYWIAHSSTARADMDFFARFWLWIAWYGDADDVRIPIPWKEETTLLWQYDTPARGREFGMDSDEVDMNRVVGSVDRFLDVFNVGGEVPPSLPTEEGENPMYICVVSPGKAPKIYAGPTVKSPSHGYLQSGQSFSALQVKTDVTDPKRPGRQVWLEMTDHRWTFAEYPRMDGSPEIFVIYKAVDEPPPPPQEGGDAPDEIPIVVSAGATIKIGEQTHIYQSEAVTVTARKV